MIFGLRANGWLGPRMFWQVILLSWCVSFAALYARSLIDVFSCLSFSSNTLPTDGRVLRDCFKYSCVTGFLFEIMLL